MKRLKLIFTFLMIFSLMACDHYEKLDYEIAGYPLYYQSHGACEMYVMEIIYEDDDTLVYFGSSGCTTGPYYYLKANSKIISVKEAMDEGVISLEDCLSADLPFLIVEDK